MDFWQKAWGVIAITLALGLGAFSAGYSLGDESEDVDVGNRVGPGEGLAVIRDAFEKILSSSVDPPSEQVLARGAVKGMVEALKDATDPYALFYTPQGFKSLQELTTGRFTGIGVWLKEKDGLLEIVSVLPDTPARAAGLQRGDVVEVVDGDPVSEMTVDEAIARIKGPAGSKVSLRIARGGSPLSFTITRAEIDFPNLRSRLTAGNLGYVQLMGFARGAGEQLYAEIEELTGDGAEGILLDLRDNGGGLFSEAVDVASVFIEDGKIVRYKVRSEPEVVYEAEGDAFEKIPVVVLVNEGTASASEIVAGALQDSERAIVVGVDTYGKGSVQELVRLVDSSVVKLTTAAYYTPDGRDINGKGIDPDVEIDAGARAQKTQAIEILKGIVLSAITSEG
jgi:carboxyl-terminal processing protease